MRCCLKGKNENLQRDEGDEGDEEIDRWMMRLKGWGSRRDAHAMITYLVSLYVLLLLLLGFVGVENSFDVKRLRIKI